MIDKFYELIHDRMPIPAKYKMRRDGDHFIVLPSNIGVLVSLNETSSFILYSCDGKKNINQLANLLHEHFKSIPVLELKKDVTICLRKLEAMGLIIGYN
ncbi:TPA: PqqD family protein [Streptococcus agalactiae]|uniref:PqqD family protein n=1 Tax=Ezakiella peruensis TaxID=1464038 RepID=UPI000C1B147B|nr:PqqD family protein [Ezakiella peruensis]HEQ5069896.1 PqqD family protein [Streptococcus pyogenes]